MSSTISLVKEAVKDVLLKSNLFYRWKDRGFYDDAINQTQHSFYNDIIDTKRLIFDIGGNIGQRAKIFADLDPVEGVIVFEPQPFCVRHLKSRFASNNKVTIEEIALSDKEGSAPMFISSSHVLSTLSQSFINTAGKSVFSKEDWSEEITVRTQTLDNIISRYGSPDFVKIDVEGYEISVLKGLTSPVKHLSFEFMPNLFEDAEKCIDYIHCLSSGYRFNYTLGEALKYELDEYAPYESFLEVEELRTANSFGDIYALLM